jgi:hypothetical protein
MRSKSTASIIAARPAANTLNRMPSGLASLMNGTLPPNRLMTNDTA